MSAAASRAPERKGAHGDARDRVDRFHRTRRYAAIYTGTRNIIRLAFHLLMRLRVHGRQYVPRTGPLIVASNHLHNFDPMVVGVAVPRPLFYMAKKELFAVGAAGRILAFFGAFPIDRGAADRAALRYAVHVVEDGFALCMFPEGTRSLTGKIERVLPGAAFVALRTGAPILPVAVTGTQTLPLDAKAAQAGKKRRGRAAVTVTFGPTFRLGTGADGKRLSMEAATDEIMRHVAALLPPEYRGIYGDAPGGGG